MMLGSKIPVNTVAIGCAASMGFLIFISGKNRISTPNTTFLSHQYSLLNEGGKYHELLAGRKDQDFIAERFIEMYKKFCSKKITDKKIREELLGKSDCYLTPKEVLDLGFCDEIKFLN
jgi:ATP-dependent protease ClpP protease subunit